MPKKRWNPLTVSCADLVCEAYFCSHFVFLSKHTCSTVSLCLDFFVLRRKGVVGSRDVRELSWFGSVVRLAVVGLPAAWSSLDSAGIAGGTIGVFGVMCEEVVGFSSFASVGV